MNAASPAQGARWLDRHGAHLLLVGLTLLGGWLRVFAIGTKTLWLDEAFSIWIAHHPPDALIDWLIRIDQHPPLYYLALAGWMRLAGDLQGAVRTLSALCSTATIPLLYQIAKQLGFARRTALVATLFLTVSPFHVHFAQETRMYALLTLLVAGAMLGAVRVLQTAEPAPAVRLHPAAIRPTFAKAYGSGALLLILCQTGVMWTHNTATVFFPLALNVPVALAWFRHRWQGRTVAMPAVNRPHFACDWMRIQLLAFLLWMPWAIPFVRQALGVDQEFWIPAPDIQRVVDTFASFAFAHLPSTGITPLLLAGYLALAMVGFVSLRDRSPWGLFLLSLWLIPIVASLLVSLRRPIFYDRTLIWTTLPFYLLLAMGIHAIGSRWERAPPAWARPLQALLVTLIVVVSCTGILFYQRFFEKEEWAAAAAYVAEQAQPGDLILFNATWVQLPFDYYFRHFDSAAERRGMPSDLFDSGQLEPKMTQSDLAYLATLIERRNQVWLVYSHDWYTDPEQLIPDALEEWAQVSEEKPFSGVRIIRYALDADP